MRKNEEPNQEVEAKAEDEEPNQEVEAKAEDEEPNQEVEAKAEDEELNQEVEAKAEAILEDNKPCYRLTQVYQKEGTRQLFLLLISSLFE